MTINPIHRTGKLAQQSPIVVAALLISHASWAFENSTASSQCLAGIQINARPIAAHTYLGEDFAQIDVPAIFQTEIAKLPSTRRITTQPYTVTLDIKTFETSGYIGFSKHAKGEIFATIADASGRQITEYSTHCNAKAPLSIASPDIRIRSAARLCQLQAAKSFSNRLGEHLGEDCVWRDTEMSTER